MTPELKELKAFLLLQLASPVIATAPNDPVVKAHMERIHTWIGALSQAESNRVDAERWRHCKPEQLQIE